MLPACFARCPYAHPCQADCPLVLAQFGPEPRKNAAKRDANGVKLCARCHKRPRETGPYCLECNAARNREWYWRDIEHSRGLCNNRYRNHRRAQRMAMRGK